VGRHWSKCVIRPIENPCAETLANRANGELYRDLLTLYVFDDSVRGSVQPAAKRYYCNYR